MHLLHYSFLLPLATALQIPFTSSPPSPPPAPPAPLQLTLRQSVHIPLHNSSIPALHRHYSPADLHLSTLGGDPASLHLAHQQTSTWIPSSPLAFQAARRHAYHSKHIRKLGLLPSWEQVRDEELAGTLEWEEHEIRMPNTSDITTIGALARMSSNAYVEEGAANWWDLEGHWNVVSSSIRPPFASDEHRELMPSRFASPTRLDGMRMASEVMSLLILPTRPSSSPSR